MSTRRSLGAAAVVLLFVGAFFVLRLGWRGGVDGPVVTSPRDLSGDSRDAFVSATVLIEDDCVFLSGGDGGSVAPVVFPAGTRWDAETEEIIVGSERVRSGGVVAGSGGHLSGETLATVIGERAFEAIQRCMNSNAVATTDELESIGVGATVFNPASLPFVGSSVEVVEAG